MESGELRKLAEENLGHVLRRANANDGKISQEDLATASLFCRVVEAETVGSPYAGAGLLPTRNWDGDLAKAMAAVPSGN